MVAVTLRETPKPATRKEMPSTKAVFGYLFRLSSFRHVSFGAALYAFVGYAAVGWAPTFLERSHGMTSGPIGTWLALIFGVGGAIGTLLGGRLADRLGVRDKRAYTMVPAIALFASYPACFVIRAICFSAPTAPRPWPASPNGSTGGCKSSPAPLVSDQYVFA